MTKDGQSGRLTRELPGRAPIRRPIYGCRQNGKLWQRSRKTYVSTRPFATVSDSPAKRQVLSKAASWPRCRAAHCDREPRGRGCRGSGEIRQQARRLLILPLDGGAEMPPPNEPLREVVWPGASQARYRIDHGAMTPDNPGAATAKSCATMAAILRAPPSPRCVGSSRRSKRYSGPGSPVAVGGVSPGRSCAR